MPGAPAALVEEARSAVKDDVELLGDLEYHFGVLRAEVDVGAR